MAAKKIWYCKKCGVCYGKDAGKTVCFNCGTQLVPEDVTPEEWKNKSKEEQEVIKSAWALESSVREKRISEARDINAKKWGEVDKTIPEPKMHLLLYEASGIVLGFIATYFIYGYIYTFHDASKIEDSFWSSFFVLLFPMIAGYFLGNLLGKKKHKDALLDRQNAVENYKNNLNQDLNKEIALINKEEDMKEQSAVELRTELEKIPEDEILIGHNAQKKPVKVAFSKGNSIFVEYFSDNTISFSKQDALDFVHRIEADILYNCLKGKFRNKLISMDHIDPSYMNDSALGLLRPLAEKKHSVLSHVPNSREEIILRLESIKKECEKQEQDGIRVVCLQDYPMAYDKLLRQLVGQLVANADRYGLFLLFTNDYSRKKNEADFECRREIAQNSYVVSLDFEAQVNQYGFSHNDYFLTAMYGMVQREHDKVTDTRRFTEFFPLIENIHEKVDELVGVNVKTSAESVSSNLYKDLFGFSFGEVKKGNRKITGIPYGVDEEGKIQSLDFEGSNFATFLTGASRSGKSSLLHTILTGLIRNYHPDDIEIWLVDFKMTEFSRYIAHMPPHVRYILLDETPEMVYDLLDRLYDILIKRQNIFKGKWQKALDVPADRYMPAMFIMIDEFSVMSQVVAESIMKGKEDYRQKLQTLLARGAALGMHFIFSSQGFTSGSLGLNDFSKKQIQQRITMKTEYDEIRASLDLKSVSATDKQMMEQLEEYHTLMRVPEDDYGNHLLLSKAIYIDDYSKQEELIDKMNAYYVSDDRFYVQDHARYVDKHPLIVEGEKYHGFLQMKELISAQLKEENEPGILPLYIGEPRRMMNLYPIHLSDNYSENALVIGSLSETDAICSVLMSMNESLLMRNRHLSVWSSSPSPILQKIRNNVSTGFAEFCDNADSVCGNIRRIRESVASGGHGEETIVLLGLESLIQNMSMYKSSGMPGSTPAMPKLSSGMGMMAMLEAELNKTGDPVLQDAEMKSGNALLSNGGFYDAREDLKYILTYGGKNGFHFVAVFRNYPEFVQTKLDVNLFRHRILFQIPKQDASNLVGSVNSDAVSGLPDHNFRYSDGIDFLSFKPYLLKGLSWDGWEMDRDGNVRLNSYEGDLLL